MVRSYWEKKTFMVPISLKFQIGVQQFEGDEKFKREKSEAKLAEYNYTKK